jgi:hypothetical protein
MSSGTPTLQRVDLANLLHCTVDPTEFAVARILPKQHVTLLGAHGCAGKSVLALALAAHVAAGRPWGGLKTDAGRVLFVELEDPGDLIRFRLHRICDEHGLPNEDVASRLVVVDGSSSDSELAIERTDPPGRRLDFTPTLDEIETAAEGCGLVVIDNASEAFAANENDRQQVRRFIRRLGHLARRHNCAVLLLAHVDKNAARSSGNGQNYSGSTSWNNTVRSRLALIEENGCLQLTQEKANLSRKIDPIDLEWSPDGVLMPLARTGNAAQERDAQDDAALLAAMVAAIKDDATLHTARKGPYSIFGDLGTYPELPSELRKNKQRFYASLTRLERSKAILKESYKDAHRHPRTRYIVRGAHPYNPGVGTHAGGVVPAPSTRSQLARGRNALGTQEVA